MPLAPQTMTPALGSLIERLRQAVIPGQDMEITAYKAAAALQACITVEDLLTPEQSEPDLQRFREQVLHVEEGGAFSVTARIILPFQATLAERLNTWSVNGVYVGQERESVLDLTADGSKLTQRASHDVPKGHVLVSVPPSDIRRVESGFRGVTIAIQIYGADVSDQSAAARQAFELPINR